jgi:hypothetical protein
MSGDMSMPAPYWPHYRNTIEAVEAQLCLCGAPICMEDPLAGAIRSVYTTIAT